MRSESRSRLTARVSVLAVIAAALAGCSADIARFSGGPLSNQDSRGAAGEVTGSLPTGRVDSQPLPAPSRPANVSSTGVVSGGGGVSSYHPSDTAPRVAAANTPITGAAVHAHAAPPATGIHVVAPRETLTSIARHYGKTRAEIAKANKIDAYAIVRVGQKLAIPGIRPAQAKPAVATHQAAATPAQPAAAAAPAKPAAPAQVATKEPVATARLATPATETPAAAAAAPAVSEMTGAVPSFRWPVRGRVIAGFGAKVNGAANDGIDLSVPEGTSVKASEEGVVAYAGNELKGYGNLVLVRHPNGFVTAYAHASEIKVKRGDQVKRGQTIALAGQTGNVNSPQLHFEIRKGSTPIDPTQYLGN